LPLAIAAFLGARIPLLPHRALDPDELEHAHAAWSIFKGMLPYRDFFEHHTPWYYYVLRPLFNCFEVDLSFESATHFLLLGRSLSFVVTMIAVLLVVSIGRFWEERRVGLMAGLLFVSQPIVLQKTIEVRPDVPALAFFLGGLALLLRGLADGAEATKRRAWLFLAGGLGLGAAIMCTQKMLFVLPGALAGLGLWLRAGRDDGAATSGGARPRGLAALAVGLGICLPGALTWAAFAFHHAGREFITNNFLLNARWKHFPTHQFLRFIVTSAPVLSLAAVGAWVFLARFRRGLERRGSEGLLLLSILVGLFLGVLVMPVPHRQYYLILLPIVCLFAAKGLFVLVDRVRERKRPAFLGVALLLLAVLPVVALAGSFRDRNDAQLAKLRTVFASTRPADPVMDGWEGMGVFRPHAFRYFFLHEEIVAMLPRPELDAYLDALESGRVRPKLIAMDKNLRSLGPRFVQFVTTHYVTSDGFFYLARD
jgi:4-amino-4-deoxy-L-arabinose transferase-like glycosyltransferase